MYTEEYRMSSADLVLSTIQSALNLDVRLMDAYVASTHSRSFVLGLLEYQPNTNLIDAVKYFKDDGKSRISESLILAGLRETFERTDSVLDIIESLSEEQKEELVTLHNESLMMDLIEEGFDFGHPSHAGLTNDGLIHLLKIRQWRKGNDPCPTVLRRFAGQFVELGVDYFMSSRSTFQKKSRRGRLLHAFFTGLDAIPFSERFSEDRIGDLPERLMLTTLKEGGKESQVPNDDPQYLRLISVASRALIQDVAERVEVIRKETLGRRNEIKEGRVKEWAELVLQSLLGRGGLFVVSNPSQFFGLDDVAQTELISHVGQAVLGFVLDQPTD
jgi:hypothetical protein